MKSGRITRWEGNFENEVRGTVTENRNLILWDDKTFSVRPEWLKGVLHSNGVLSREQIATYRTPRDLALSMSDGVCQECGVDIRVVLLWLPTPPSLIRRGVFKSTRVGCDPDEMHKPECHSLRERIWSKVTGKPFKDDPAISDDRGNGGTDSPGFSKEHDKQNAAGEHQESMGHSGKKIG